eukprot:scaffold3504_cov240-Pinguiococcus_pyrenoidosus.AAC.7
MGRRVEPNGREVRLVQHGHRILGNLDFPREPRLVVHEADQILRTAAAVVLLVAPVRPFGEEEQRGEPAHLILARQGLVLRGVHFRDDHVVRAAVGVPEHLPGRRKVLAVPAPRCVELIAVPKVAGERPPSSLYHGL